MIMVKISVVIPVYNAEEFLLESMNSLLNQTFEDFELICVNDGSKDNSLNILNDFAKKDNRVKVFNQENAGCGAARNKALNEAKGDYIYFFDPDDYILSDAFEKLYENAINTQSDIVLFKIAKFRDGESVDYSSPGFNFDDEFPESFDFNNKSFQYKDVKRHVLNSSFAPWTKLYKKEFLDSYDDFRFPTGLAFDDVPFHVMAMLRASKISFIPDYLYHYRLSNPNSVNNTSSNGIYIMDIVDIVEDFLKQNNYYNEFYNEFYKFKIEQILYYLISSNSQDYYEKAKTELLKVKQEYFENPEHEEGFIKKYMLNKYNAVIESDTFTECKLSFEILELKRKNKRLKKENKKLKKQLKKMKK